MTVLSSIPGRVLHINTHGMGGGAAKLAARLSTMQCGSGWDAHMLVGERGDAAPWIHPFETEQAHDLTMKCHRNGNLFYAFQGSHHLIENPWSCRSDIVHFHNLHGEYFNPFSIHLLAHTKPVIWTLHDMQSFTGHCAHAFDCNRWIDGCKRCPYLDTEPALAVDNSAELLAHKHLIYEHSPLWVVVPSNWLKTKVEQSVLGSHPLTLIYNGVDTSVFKPMDRQAARRILGLPQDKLLVGTVANGGAMSNPWKGGEYTQVAVEYLRETCPEVCLVDIGGSGHDKAPDRLTIPHLDDENLMAMAYNALDLFLYTPRADNCPLVVLEAMACALPIVSFDTGGIPELIADGQNGCLVPFQDIRGLVQAAELLMIDPSRRQSFGKSARQRVLMQFDQALMAERYLRLYERTLTEYRQRKKQYGPLPLTRVPRLIRTPAFMRAYDKVWGKSKPKKEKDGSHTDRPQCRPVSKEDSHCPSTVSAKEASDAAPATVGVAQIGNRRGCLPKISVVTPSYNQSAYLEKCIRSVLEQDYPEIEYIVMDGGSTDGSRQIIEKYSSRLAYWQSAPDNGHYWAVQEGINRSTGDIVTWLNSDDQFYPHAFKVAAALFMLRADIEWITGRPNGVNADGTKYSTAAILPIWSRQRYFDKRYHHPFIQQEGTFWRRSLWEKAGARMQTRLALAGDLELWARFFRHAPLHSVDYRFAAYRSHGGNRALRFMDEYLKEAAAVIEHELRLFRKGKYPKIISAVTPITKKQIAAYLIKSGFTDSNSGAFLETGSRTLKSLQDPVRLFTVDGRKPSILLTAIVSTFNAARYIQGCLEDLEAQTMASCMEIIVVDSASDQDEAAVVKDFQKHFPNIKYIRTPRRESVYAAWNRGIKVASGKYITNANTDDRHRRDALEQMVQILEARPEIDLVYADVLKTRTPNETFENCTPTGVLRWHDWDRLALLEKGCFIGPQPVWRRSVHDTYGYFDERYRVCGDYEFWLRVSQTGRFYHICHPLGLYLERPDSIEHANKSFKLREEKEISARYKDAATNGKIIGTSQSPPIQGGCIFACESTIGNGNHETDRCLSENAAVSSDQGGPIMYSPETILDTIRYLAGGEHRNEACWFLDKLIGDHPDMAAAHSERAQIAFEQNDMERAQKHYELAAELSPDSFEFQKNLGDFRYAVQKDGERALRVYEKALTLEPNNVEVLTLAGHLAVSLHRFDAAKQHYSRAISNDPDNTRLCQYLNKLNTMSATGQPEQDKGGDLYAIALEKAENGDRLGALSSLKTLIDRDAENALAHNDFGVLCFEEGEKDKALAHYQEAVRLAPENTIFQKNLGDLFWFGYGDAQAAMTRYMEALKLEPLDVEVLLAFSQVCMDTGKTNDASAFLDCVLTLEPWNEDARRMMSRLEAKEQNGYSEPDREPVKLPGEIQKNATPQDVQESIDRLLQAITESPEDARAFNDLGVLYFESGDKDRALYCYEQAVKLRPHDAVFAKNLADFYLMEKGRVEDALKLYVTVLEGDPQDVDCLIATGMICGINGKADDAYDFYQRALEIEPWNQSARDALERLNQDTNEAHGQTGSRKATA